MVDKTNHPDALPDGTLAKSTVKRLGILAPADKGECSICPDDMLHDGPCSYAAAPRQDVARQEGVADVVRAAIQYIRDQYPEDLFPDHHGARMARLTCDNIEREFKKRMEERAALAADAQREVG
jgi:hypothetical protein